MSRRMRPPSGASNASGSSSGRRSVSNANMSGTGTGGRPGSSRTSSYRRPSSNSNTAYGSSSSSSSSSTTTSSSTSSSSSSSASSSYGSSGSGRSRQQLRFKTAFHNTISHVMKKRGWIETDSDLDWDFFWADVGWLREYFDHVRFEDHQRINHFRNHYELTRKDLMMKNLKRARKSLEREDRHAEASAYAFIPPTYVLPSEYALFQEEYKRNHGGVWIMKPIGRAQGKGIFLFNKLSQISDWKKDYKWRGDSSSSSQAEAYVVQKYLDRPYLVGGKKFDLRLYMLVVNYSPLTAYLHRGGFARFSGTRFTMDVGNITNSTMHLTNAAVQKQSKEYNKERGCKWDVRDLKLFMISKHGMEAVDACFAHMQDIMIKSLESVANIIINEKNCFELYGYDIMIDEDLRPWLIEVNASPSVTADSDSDYQFKFGLLDDTLNVIDMEGEREGDEDEIGAFDLVYYQGRPYKKGDKVDLNTRLGCYNVRAKEFAHLTKKGKGN